MKQPLWLALWIIAIEAIVVMILVPGDWTVRVIKEESQLLEKRLGAEENYRVHARAQVWFNSQVIDSGLYQACLEYFVPNEEQRSRSTGMEEMGADWFVWIEGRLKAIANVYYHILSRFSLFLTWGPYFLVLLVPAVFDGITTWRIKRTNFDYASPFIHRMSTMGLGYVAIGLIALFLAPIVIEPNIIPAAIGITCVMCGLMLGNAQKRV